MLCEQSVKIQSSMSPDPYANSTPYPFGVKKEWERHNGGANYVFCDGHVKWYTPSAVDTGAYLHLDAQGRVIGNDGIHPSFKKFSTEDYIE
jgi:prepilin-type processing-associated H-X9-DG protein